VNILTIVGIEGLPEFTAGDDLAVIIAANCELEDGDVLVVTSKIVSKVEGRVVRAPDRAAAIADESVRIVASRGETVISQTRHGFVMAAAGVDASNLPTGEIALLPLDPDDSARGLRAQLFATSGKQIAVIITDTFGRPWRDGLVDQAVGCAGLSVTDDLRGKSDSFGNELHASVTAIADEVASASELVRSKLSRIPVAIVRGLDRYVIREDGPGAASLIRSVDTDWFRLGHRETITSRRTIREFSDRQVDVRLVSEAIGAAITAPAPHHSTPWRFAIVQNPETRKRLLDAMIDAWRVDLQNDGFSKKSIDARVARGVFLYSAPLLVIPCLVKNAMHNYPDASRSTAEETMFTLSGGAAVENFLLFLNAEGVGTAWVSAALFCAPVVREVLDLDPDWEPLGTIAVGFPTTPAQPRAARNVEDFYRQF
jgi:coenzyme F420-0:L-glutamate ligase/coenzyme F420-1:gamma-L-glutamate ligase